MGKAEEKPENVNDPKLRHIFGTVKPLFECPFCYKEGKACSSVL